jgi:hypothetical protein
VRKHAWVVSLSAAVLLTSMAGAAVRAADPAGSSPAPSATAQPGREPCELAERPFDPTDIHLTGEWDSQDGGVVYIQQAGDRIAWDWLSDASSQTPELLGRQWDMVGMGTLHDDGTITLDWADVPLGNAVGNGTADLRVGADLRGNLQIVGTDGGMGPGGVTLWPCVAPTRSTEAFAPAFSFRDEAGRGLWSWEIPAGVVMVPGDPSDSGIRVWRITDKAGVTCSGRTTLKPGAEAFLDWLRSRPDLVVSGPAAVTVDGRAASSVDIKAAPVATGCLDGAVRLWQTYGNDAAVSAGGMSRVIVLDVGAATLALELWGRHQDEWLPLAQAIVDTIHFTP